MCWIASAFGLATSVRHGSPIREISDGAILELYTLQARRGAQLLGPYSRFGWHHPGPLYFYLQTPFYQLAGLQPAGLQAGALAFNIGALGIVTTALGASGAPMMLSIVAAISWFAARSGGMLVSPWNPHVIVLPMATFVVVTAAFAADGRRSLLLWMIGLGSFVVQTHVAMAPLTAALFCVAIVAQPRALRESWMWAAALALLLWLPPLVEQATHRPGNLIAIAKFFSSRSRGQSIGVATAAWASALASPFESRFRIADGTALNPPGWWAYLVAAAQVAGVVAMARVARGREQRVFWMAVSCGVATIVAWASATRIHDRIVDHEVFWMSVLGPLNAGVIVGGAVTLAWPSLARPVEIWSTSVRIAIVAAMLLLTLWPAFIGAQGMQRALERLQPVDDHAVDVLVAAIDRFVSDTHARRPMFHIEPQVWPIAAGALLQVEKSGLTFAVSDPWVFMFGEPLAPTGAEDHLATIGGTTQQPTLMTLR